MAEAKGTAPHIRKHEDLGRTELAAVYSEIDARHGEDFTRYHHDRAANTLLHPTDVQDRYQERLMAAIAESAEPIDTSSPGLPAKIFRDSVKALLEGNEVAEILPIELLRVITREQLVRLSAEFSIVISGVNEAHPDGGVNISHLVSSTLEDDKPSEDSTITALMAHKILKPVTGIVPRKAPKGSEPPKPGLNKIPVNCSVAAVNNNSEWSKSAVLPEGDWVVPGADNASFQYAQGVFEGMVGMKNGEVAEESPFTGVGIEAEVVNGRITLFRPEENARRFIKSCERMGLPPISVDQFIQAVIAAIKNNKEYIPENGKLYIRPFMVGLRGGLGIHPAKDSLFAVEVLPYGEYLSKGEPEKSKKYENPSPEQIRLEKISNQKTAKVVLHPRGSIGRDKVPPNYGPIMALKEPYIEEGFTDVLLIDEDGNIQEYSSSNFFSVQSKSKNPEGKNEFVVCTPPLSSNALPGINQETLLTVLRDPRVQERLGCEIDVRDDMPLSEHHLNPSIGANGIFSSGTAAGVSSYGAVETSGEFNSRHPHFYEYKENPRAINEFLVTMRQLLQPDLDDINCDEINRILSGIFDITKMHQIDPATKEAILSFQIESDPANFAEYSQNIVKILDSLSQYLSENGLADVELFESLPNKISHLRTSTQALEKQRMAKRDLRDLFDDLEASPENPHEYVEKIKNFFEALLRNPALPLETLTYLSQSRGHVDSICKQYLAEAELFGDTQKFIDDVKQLLIDLRKGKVPGYENWAMVVE